MCDLYFGRSAKNLILEEKRKGTEVDDGHVSVADELYRPDVPGGVITITSLPYYYKNDTVTTVAETNSYGYFGDYAPVSRDLKPFYEAAKQSSIQVNICGSPNNLFASTDSITIYPRLPLDKLKPIDDKTNVLIFLCNRKGGQIPGKIYQYSATYKTILFILDGTDEEKKVLREYFEKFNRYVFCENTVEDITRAINDIENGNIGSVKNEPVEAFNPKETIRKILAGEMG